MLSIGNRIIAIIWAIFIVGSFISVFLGYNPLGNLRHDPEREIK
jgi:hypothetical protein